MNYFKSDNLSVIHSFYCSVHPTLNVATTPRGDDNPISAASGQMLQPRGFHSRPKEQTSIMEEELPKVQPQPLCQKVFHGQQAATRVNADP